MRAISSMATRHVLADLAADAVREGFPALEIESVGGVDAAARVAGGEAFDLVFLADGALRTLAEQGHVDPDSITPLLLSQVGVAVRADAGDAGGSGGSDGAGGPDGLDLAGAVTPAFADAAGMRDALRTAGRIGYSTGPSGTTLVRMIDAWGLTAELGDRLVQARPGVPVARSLAEGEVELGFQQLSELVGEPGIRILGILPEDCAIDTVFSGGVPTAADDPAAALRTLAFFRAAARRGTAAAHSFVAL